MRARSLATRGLAVLMERETDPEDAAGVMSGLTVTLPKQLVRLIERGPSPPSLARTARSATSRCS